MRIPKRKSEINSRQNIDPYITRQKAGQIKADLKKMIKIIRPKLVREVEEHAKLGDFSENAAYQMAKGKLRGLNNRILFFQNILDKAIIIESDPNSDIISLGSKVTVETNAKQFTYRILGSQETNPEVGIISHQSPIGSALLGHKVGDVVEVEINDKLLRYEIIDVK